jgi:hypothetical protein
MDGTLNGQVTDEFARDVCRVGQGEKCCAFLTFDGTWMCAKADLGLELTIMSRLERGAMTAKGDNCSGPPDFTRE